MRAMLLNRAAPIEENPLVMVDQVKLEPDEGEVLLRVNVCGICHTDLHTVEGEIIPPIFPTDPRSSSGWHGGRSRVDGE